MRRRRPTRSSRNPTPTIASTPTANSIHASVSRTPLSPPWTMRASITSTNNAAIGAADSTTASTIDTAAPTAPPPGQPRDPEPAPGRDRRAEHRVPAGEEQPDRQPEHEQEHHRPRDDARDPVLRVQHRTEQRQHRQQADDAGGPPPPLPPAKSGGGAVDGDQSRVAGARVEPGRSTQRTNRLMQSPTTNSHRVSSAARTVENRGSSDVVTGVPGSPAEICRAGGPLSGAHSANATAGQSTRSWTA